MTTWQWINAAELCMQGRGWKETTGSFDWLPAKSQVVDRDVVWELGRCAAGAGCRTV